MWGVIAAFSFPFPYPLLRPSAVLDPHLSHGQAQGPAGSCLKPSQGVDVFHEDLCIMTENLLGSYFPKKISELDAFFFLIHF